MEREGFRGGVLFQATPPRGLRYDATSHADIYVRGIEHETAQDFGDQNQDES